MLLQKKDITVHIFEEYKETFGNEVYDPLHSQYVAGNSVHSRQSVFAGASGTSTELARIPVPQHTNVRITVANTTDSQARFRCCATKDIDWHSPESSMRTCDAADAGKYMPLNYVKNSVATGRCIYFYTGEMNLVFMNISNGNVAPEITVEYDKLVETKTYSRTGFKINDNISINDVVNVQDFGAIGDGINNDTEALEAAIEFAHNNKLPVFFPAGKYMVNRSLTIHDGAEFFGMGKHSIISRMAGVATYPTQSINSDDYVDGEEYTINVNSTIGWRIGDQFIIAGKTGSTLAEFRSGSNTSSVYGAGDVLTKDPYANARWNIVGKVLGLTKTSITFTPLGNKGTGGTSTFQSGPEPSQTLTDISASCISNTCAVFRSWAGIEPCTHAYIHDLTIDGAKSTLEFGDWSEGAIHFDACDGLVRAGITYQYNQEYNRVENCTIKNSPFDAISDQGAGFGRFINNDIFNSYWHGVHMGTNYIHALIDGNNIDGCKQGAAVFHCQNVSETKIVNNTFTNCVKGTSDFEYGTNAGEVIIDGNIFNNISSYCIHLGDKGAGTRSTNIVISNNIFMNTKASVMFLGKLSSSNTRALIVGNSWVSKASGTAYFISAGTTAVCTVTSNMGMSSLTSASTVYSGGKIYSVGNSWDPQPITLLTKEALLSALGAKNKKL